MDRGYTQFYLIAMASEILATRWAPLILRELMTGQLGLSQEVYERAIEPHSNIGAGDSSDSLRLGLMIVQRTADELGCKIDVRTRAGHGTRISMLMRQKVPTYSRMNSHLSACNMLLKF